MAFTVGGVASPNYSNVAQLSGSCSVFGLASTASEDPVSEACKKVFSMLPAIQPLAKPVQSLARGLQPPTISSQNLGWKNLLVEELYQSPGEELCQSTTQHMLCLSLNQRPSRIFQKIGDRNHTSPSAEAIK
jgi:hypothetical protein